MTLNKNYKQKAEEIYNKFFNNLVVDPSNALSEQAKGLNMEELAECILDQQMWNKKKAKEHSLICINQILDNEFIGSANYNHWTKIKQEVERIN